ncbi:ArsR family transcriptional regulator [Nitrosopumilus sp. b1]|uniref:ArsR/SmtB family transcription factor n=1 Tax=Nitrosopumilus sp. b1 TaxID=2109907 RepID=UPI0015F5DE61|nr:winged helix-turn-helix domain-containing protein [Nitrosopumilus sp. b1]KAF6243925.1 ArsR family transcriptional regulator [Nitrosopumilus sp. b1]
MASEVKDETMSISDKVEILTTEDEKIKAIGEILSSDPSRQILKLLFNDSLTANQLSQKTGSSLPLTIYHLKKMQEAGVVKITNVGKNTKSHDMKFYTIDKLAIVILPTEMKDPAKKSKSLFNSFNRIHRLATLGAACVAAWFSSQFIQSTKTVSVDTISDETMQFSAPEMAQRGMEETAIAGSEMAIESTEMASAKMAPAAPAPPTTGEPVIDIFWSVIVVLSIVIIGLTIEIGIKSRK